MNKNDLRELARRYFIFDAGMSAANLIRKIQVAEGHSDCFAMGNADCRESECRWRPDCLSGAGAQEEPISSSSDMSSKEGSSS